jgi:hypothetical protein
MFHRLTLFAAGLIAALSLAGCGRGGPEIVEIEGTVTRNGKPVPNVRIYFVPTDGRPSWGVSDEQGRFVLDYDLDYDGAKVGTHTVWIQDESSNVDPTLVMSGAARPKRNPEMAAILEKYGRDKSQLKVDVTKADKNFQLKLD